MALVAPNICRFTINGSYLGRPTANILDMLVVDEPGPGDRSQRLTDLAEGLRVAFSVNVLPLLVSAYEAQSVTYVDLDSADGATGLADNSEASPWPRPGGISGVPYAASVAMLVTKQGNARRGQRQGRWFLPGLSEANVTGNLIDADMAEAVNDALAAFLGEISEGEQLPFVGALPVVTHTRNVGTPTDPDIEFVDYSVIQSLVCQRQVASQRRRNRG